MLKATSSPGKVMVTVFWNSQGVLLAPFQKCDDNVISATYCEVLLRLRDAIRRNDQANWQEEYCLIMTMPDPIQPGQRRREFKNYNGNFLNICLTARTWPPSDFHLFSLLKTTLVADVSLMTKRLKLRCGCG
jgi:hypothetical protein